LRWKLSFAVYWVIGGALSAALDADWLTAAWDENAYNYVTRTCRGAG
jgi:hypothetical protein